VLDNQMALTRESALPEPTRKIIASMDGSETLCLGESLGHTYRVCSRLGRQSIKELQELERNLLSEGDIQQEAVAAWDRAFLNKAGGEKSEAQLFICGQDIVFAPALAKKYVTVGGVLEALRQSIPSRFLSVQKHKPFEKGSLLAEFHGTQYPVVQGPMARVSDSSVFAHEIAKSGGLPFIAASWMSRPELENIMTETSGLLSGRPWGIGLLGFLPPDVYNDQLQSVIKCRPPFALIAGGQAYQALALEKEGIRTYIHVPSLGLMKMFLDEGVTRFVLEGRESGGHVGPLSSFVLWNLITDVIQEYLEAHAEHKDYHLLFAGGIHDALSAAMVAILAAPLAELGVHIGIQMGSAYLFCREALSTGAIVEQYQKQAIRCDGTQVLETSPGHAERSMETPFTLNFLREKQRLLKEGASQEKQQQTLEQLKQGRLQVATKGICDKTDYSASPVELKLLPVSPEEQYRQGNYMIGQVAALQNRQSTLEALHADVTANAGKKIAALHERLNKARPAKKKGSPSDVAIIGIACLLPKAHNRQTYFENILNKVNAISEIPQDHWDWQDYYDPDTRARDKISSKWGGFIDAVPFDPVRYGMPPRSLPSIEPLQLLTLETVRHALDDAGYAARPFPRESTSVIIGISGTGDLSQRYGFRAALPEYFGADSKKLAAHFKDLLPEWTEDSFPGILPNVTAGRVANRFNLGGINYSIDAACASSLAALYMGVRELENRTSDMVVVGGADTLQNPFTYLCFSKTLALSPRGQSRAFDKNADGTVLGEGIAVVILKRLADAERDGDRIYAVIKGVGAASDGRDKSLTAPRIEGQVRALEKAFSKADFSPATVGLIEAHGTGTAVGDQVEIQSLSKVLREHNSARQSCAVGSVKSMIGHTKSAAGLASLIKTSLALYYKVLPPTNGVEHPTPAISASDSPVYINTEPHPWFQGTKAYPRRAGVSAFGFGGTNFHAALEEYTGEYLSDSAKPVFQKLPSELLLWAHKSREMLLDDIMALKKACDQGLPLSLADLAYTLNGIYEQKKTADKNLLTLAVVATSPEDLREKLSQAEALLKDDDTAAVRDPRGIYFAEQPLGRDGSVAFLFPGQGSQYTNMLCDLALQFPKVRECFERSDRILYKQLSRPLSSFIFPPTAFTDAQKLADRRALTQTHIAQPAIGTADLAMFNLLSDFGVKPDMVAGHSYGEYVALCAAGVFSENELIALSEARGRIIVDAAGTEPGVMAAVHAGFDAVSTVLM
ncbi:MAG: beta-ketoacyl synthase N-terminal-like domain-containing protein, partial [Pseudomonadota bacterium]